VRAELRRRSNWLLIFDNAEDVNHIRPSLPGGTGHVLITTRRGGFSYYGPVLDLDVLPVPRLSSYCAAGPLNSPTTRPMPSLSSPVTYHGPWSRPPPTWTRPSCRPPVTRSGFDVIKDQAAVPVAGDTSGHARFNGVDMVVGRCVCVCGTQTCGGSFCVALATLVGIGAAALQGLTDAHGGCG